MSRKGLLEKNKAIDHFAVHDMFEPTCVLLCGLLIQKKRVLKKTIDRCVDTTYAFSDLLALIGQCRNLIGRIVQQAFVTQ